MIDYSDIFRSQAESLNTAGMEGILRAADVPREVAQNFSVKEIVLNMLSGDAAVNQEKVLDLLKTMFFGEIRGLVSLAAQLIWISAVMMPFGSYLNATYFTLRSGGQTFVTFLFDSCFMWVFCVPLAFCLSRFTNLPILPLYAICQATDFIKCVIGTVMLKQGKWIQNLTV